ncbi:RNA 3'-terminal phosphate cyclase domain-containing protein [Chaetomium fimeti]|uniref:RNA 3'-terminal phosphate cyclase domain-containing protein n=1 Tax=Chaetomium fimeti TaxID=1854472 RepID=A0AAE0HMY1_9PEZI|nr:RNA 3'-terminal phosphate cyclase domain-containing protein [Chaetomium fimeti]
MAETIPIIELDGRTGEGGGQLVRIACALAAVASQPIRITNVRGNRESRGGLKSQHVTAIQYLAEATGADVSGLSAGSHTLEFHPQLRPSELASRSIKIAADSPAASTMLIFQAVFPFLLLAGNSKGEAVRLEISGGTNVSFSLSFEYLDQVLLPTLQEAFGVRVERRLLRRGWSLGKQQRGAVEFRFTPLRPGEPLRLRKEGTVYGGENALLGDVDEVEEIDVSMIVPEQMQESLEGALEQNLQDLFPNAKVEFKLTEDSGADSRIYVLLVAKAKGGKVRWGRDSLQSMPKKPRGKGKGGLPTPSALSESIAGNLSRKLYSEVVVGGAVDEFLQDQLVIFQALAEGRTSFPRSDAKDGLEQGMTKLAMDGKMSKRAVDKPFGEGSTHTSTARWVASKLLPDVAWYGDGRVCEGVGIHMEK